MTGLSILEEALKEVSEETTKPAKKRGRPKGIAQEKKLLKNSGYYDAGGISTLDIIRAKLTPEQYKGFCLGNALKYACRVNFKGQTKSDAKKAIDYVKWFEGEVAK